SRASLRLWLLGASPSALARRRWSATIQDLIIDSVELVSWALADSRVAPVVRSRYAQARKPSISTSTSGDGAGAGATGSGAEGVFSGVGGSVGVSSGSGSACTGEVSGADEADFEGRPIAIPA